MIGLITFACVFGCALFGMGLSLMLPKHHLDKESQDAVKLGAGLIATMAALVLGLLVSSAKSSFDTMNDGIIEMGAKVIMLDRVLASYGLESKEVRDAVRGALVTAMKQIWPEEKTGQAQIDVLEKSTSMEGVQIKLRALTPQTDTQRLLQSQALQIANDMAQQRWMLIEQRQKSIPAIFLVLLVFWLAMLFTSFGMFAPRHATMVAVYCVTAISISGALFIILEMNNPLEGIIKVSSAPLHKALDHLGREAGK